ncbi:MAG: hypothetical protein GY867_03275 [bacterium]|nr:hypothetical protein [bacterium]
MSDKISPPALGRCSQKVVVVAGCINPDCGWKCEGEAAHALGLLHSTEKGHEVWVEQTLQIRFKPNVSEVTPISVPPTAKVAGSAD